MSLEILEMNCHGVTGVTRLVREGVSAETSSWVTKRKTGSIPKVALCEIVHTHEKE